MGRVDSGVMYAAVDELDALIAEVAHIELTAALAQTAGGLAQAHGLRGYDSVHLAAVASVNDDDLVLVTGDSDLASAAASIGIAVSLTAG